MHNVNKNVLDYNNQIEMTSNNSENENESIIDMNDSQCGMNEQQMQMFLNVRRSKSDDSVVGKIFNQTIGTQIQRSRPLVITIPNNTIPINNNIQSSIPLNTPSIWNPPISTVPTDYKLFRKIKKEKKKNESDYSKNICGYITKKIIRELCSPNYSNHVKGLCAKYNCEYQQLKNFYLPKIQQVTGPSHIPSLLIADNKAQENIKQAFKEFFEWFIKCRYLRYLLIEGKMADKKAYINYKNSKLLGMLNESKKQNGSKLNISQQSEQDQDSDQEMKDQSQKKQLSKPKTLNGKTKQHIQQNKK